MIGLGSRNNMMNQLFLQKLKKELKLIHYFILNYTVKNKYDSKSDLKSFFKSHLAGTTYVSYFRLKKEKKEKGVESWTFWIGNVPVIIDKQLIEEYFEKETKKFVELHSIKVKQNERHKLNLCYLNFNNEN